MLSQLSPGAADFLSNLRDKFPNQQLRACCCVRRLLDSCPSGERSSPSLPAAPRHRTKQPSCARRTGKSARPHESRDSSPPLSQPCYNQGFPMAEYIPFRALRYDPNEFPLAQVVTQPYDKITPAMQDRYYAASPYNLVRIILGRREPADNPANNVYTRAAADLAAPGAPRASCARTPLPRSMSIPRPSPPRRERNRSSAADSSPSAAWRTIPPKWFSATSKLWPSPRPTASTCSAPPAPTTSRSSCSTKIPARSMPLLAAGAQCASGDRRHRRIPGSQPRLADFRSRR